jgi:hypothetical protein
MITISDLAEMLPAHLVYAPANTRNIQINKIIAGDLMSDVLVTIDQNYLLVTSLATDQAIRTADIAGAAAVLLVNDKLPTAAMKALAAESGIPLLATPLPMYEVCVALGALVSPVLGDSAD